MRASGRDNGSASHVVASVVAAWSRARTHDAGSRSTRRMLGVVAFALFLGACAGDLGHEAQIVNASSDTVTVFLVGRRSPQYKIELKPGESRQTAYPYSEPKDKAFIARVEAVGPQGQLVFCHDYWYPDLEKVSWTIRIQAGELACN
jgi:hypothetical protein